jgi:glycosyltransferase involved in cell wall biosynthesis
MTTRSTASLARISVVMPSFNTAPFLKEALDSALSQEPPPFEVIVQDGGSTDGSVELLRTFGDRVEWRSEPDSGQTQALNRAIARATGNVVVWLNADDLILPGALAAVERAFVGTPDADFVYGDYDMIRGDGSVMRRFQSSPYDPDRIFLRGCYIFSGSIYFGRHLLERVGPFDERLHACMDLDYLLRIGQARTVHLGVPVAQFRMSGAGKSSRMRATFLREAHAVRRRAAGRSRRRRLTGFAIDAWNFLLLASEPVRHTRLWSAMRGRKRL